MKVFKSYKGGITKQMKVEESSQTIQSSDKESFETSHSLKKVIKQVLCQRKFFNKSCVEERP